MGTVCVLALLKSRVIPVFVAPLLMVPKPLIMPLIPSVNVSVALKLNAWLPSVKLFSVQVAPVPVHCEAVVRVTLPKVPNESVPLLVRLPPKVSVLAADAVSVPPLLIVRLEIAGVVVLSVTVWPLAIVTVSPASGTPLRHCVQVDVAAQLPVARLVQLTIAGVIVPIITPVS